MLNEHKQDFLGIQKVSDQGIQIANKTYQQSLVIVGENVQTDWNLSSVQELGGEDVQRLLQLPADVILIGSGHTHAFAPANVQGRLLQAGKGVECMSTQAACRTYNILAGEGRRVAALLIYPEAPQTRSV